MAGMIVPEAVQIREIGLCHALMAQPEVLETGVKVELLETLARTGLRHIEATGFLRPDVVPQLADADVVLAHADVPDDVCVAVLVANQRGLERALAVAPAVGAISIVVSASETHHRWHNGRRSVDETLRAHEDLVRQARDAGLPTVATIATSFGCPAEGYVAPERVQEIALELAAAGATQIGFSDTAGAAGPRDVDDFFARMTSALPGVQLGARFHQTRHQGMANVLAALGAGCGWFDASLAALARPSAAHGATAVVATEDLVSLLGQLGIDTGVDPAALGALARGYRYPV